MEAINRRTFLTRTSATVAAVSVAAIVPAQLAGAAVKPIPEEEPIASMTEPEMAATVIAQIKNLSSGEIALFSGAQEVTLFDRQLASRLARAAVRS